jgi:hypothetical protein
MGIRVQQAIGTSVGTAKRDRPPDRLHVLHARYPIIVQFGSWYPLAEAEAHAPAGETVLQLRLAEGLIDYPRGKRAMVHYEHAADGSAAARLLGERYVGRALLCRHLEIADGIAVDVAAFYAKVRGDFVRRFGAPPGLPP